MARYVKKDAYHQKAKREAFAARSVYKLDEIDTRFRIAKKGDRVVDLGASPGSWLQYLSTKVGPTGLVLGYDIVPIEVTLGPPVHTRVADVFTLTPDVIRRDGFSARHPDEPVPDSLRTMFDALLSDMAPKTTGIRDTDQARSEALVEMAMSLATELLAPDGVFVAKTFSGRGFDELFLAAKRTFKDARVLRPEATRDGSRECFIIARGLRVTSREEPTPPRRDP